MKFEEYRAWLRDHDELESQELDYLDSIDLGLIICANEEKTVHDIMEIIEDSYEDDYLSKYQNDEELFNYITQDDFVKYIHWRYGIQYRELVEYKFDIWN